MAARSHRLALLATVAVGIAVSCGFGALPQDLDQDVCDGARVHLRVENANACTVCIENHCCQETGDCDESCRSEVLAAHQCVINAGRRAGPDEPACRLEHLQSDKSQATYACTREHCGEPCGMPVCKLDPGVPAMGGARCDDCFAGSCCTEFNKCAGDRRCLLMLTCITERCRDQFAQLLTSAASPRADSLVKATCGNERLPGGPDDGPDDCFVGCFVEHVRFDPAAADGGDSDTRASACLASQVFSCGAEANCGARCPGPDAGAPLADASAEASADAAADADDAAADADADGG